MIKNSKAGLNAFFIFYISIKTRHYFNKDDQSLYVKNPFKEPKSYIK